MIKKIRINDTILSVKIIENNIKYIWIKYSNKNYCINIKIYKSTSINYRTSKSLSGMTSSYIT